MKQKNELKKELEKQKNSAEWSKWLNVLGLVLGICLLFTPLLLLGFIILFICGILSYRAENKMKQLTIKILEV